MHQILSLIFNEGHAGNFKNNIRQLQRNIYHFVLVNKSFVIVKDYSLICVCYNINYYDE